MTLTFPSQLYPSSFFLRAPLWGSFRGPFRRGPCRGCPQWANFTSSRKRNSIDLGSSTPLTAQKQQPQWLFFEPENVKTTNFKQNFLLVQEMLHSLNTFPGVVSVTSAGRLAPVIGPKSVTYLLDSPLSGEAAVILPPPGHGGHPKYQLVRFIQRKKTGHSIFCTCGQYYSCQPFPSGCRCFSFKFLEI